MNEGFFDISQCSDSNTLLHRNIFSIGIPSIVYSYFFDDNKNQKEDYNFGFHEISKN